MANNLKDLYSEILKAGKDENKLNKLIVRYGAETSTVAHKSLLINEVKNSRILNDSEKKELISILRVKHIRTLSGVTPVTVLTSPYPCPGKCIFCPSDVRMPKSYISNEPGAQRALMYKFDPFDQVFNRLISLHINGHSVEKIELIVLGGTWSVYPDDYKIWFIKRCFDALNSFDAKQTHFQDKTYRAASEIHMPDYVKNYNLSVPKEANMTPLISWEMLAQVQHTNETATSRCVGLSIETRPDELNQEEIHKIRRLGATKVQLGVQSLNDKVLELVKRGHNVDSTKEAFKNLRLAGFKIQAHWMPNLYGSTPKEDLEDYKKLVSDPNFIPDEIKIYPCSLLPKTELAEIYEQKKWQPYDKETITDLLVDCVLETPRWCRLSRIVRDIPSTEIAVGNKTTNLRQQVDKKISQRNSKPVEIRYREIKDAKISDQEDIYKETQYKTMTSIEFFLEITDTSDRIKGFLRLSLPNTKSYLTDIEKKAIIRELHVYGQATPLGKTDIDATQHKGIGKKLIQTALSIAVKHGFSETAVISSVGTREYYAKQDFKTTGMYQTVHN